MRFLVDECTGPAVAKWLKERSHHVFSVFEKAPGISDDEVLLTAFQEDCILITNDKDFGEKVYRRQQAHHGIILLRLKDERSKDKIAVLEKLLNRYTTELIDQFVVVTENQARFGRI